MAYSNPSFLLTFLKTMRIVPVAAAVVFAAVSSSIARFILRRRHFTVQGLVTPGNKQGTKLGAATANLPIEAAQKLPKGLYSSTVTIGASTAPYRGLLYYGYNSLTGKDCLEVHLFDFSANLYGEHLTITTKKFLRRPKKFSDPKKLAAQIEQDIRKALKS